MCEITKTTEYCINIKNTFSFTNEDEEKMQIQMARLSVLYQDILIELDGALEAAELKELRHSDESNRRFYFVRRGLGTTWEIKQAVDVLQMNKAFQGLKTTMRKENRDMWDDAVKFFQEHQGDLKRWRNDQGGHFTDVAAKFAIDNMPPELKGEIVVFKQGEGAGAMMPFSYQLVAVALSMYRSPDEDFQQHFDRMFGLMRDSHMHAVRIGHVIVGEHLLRG